MSWLVIVVFSIPIVIILAEIIIIIVSVNYIKKNNIKPNINNRSNDYWKDYSDDYDEVQEMLDSNALRDPYDYSVNDYECYGSNKS